jgi:tetratricopeptide (TPR) repeat protein
MAGKQKIPPSPEIKRIQERLRKAFAAGDEERACLELADLGLAYFKNQQDQKGLETFSEALEIARRLERLDLQVHCVGRKAHAYQETNRLLDAYQITAEILAIAERQQDIGLKCDTLAHQAQIQMEYGDTGSAQKKLLEAYQIASDSNDQHRIMNLNGLLGSCAFEMGEHEQAEAYFDKALSQARSADDLTAETRFLNGLGILLLHQGKLDLAEPLYQKILTNLDEEGEIEEGANYAIKSTALFHLTRIHSSFGAYEKVNQTARLGQALSKHRDPELAIFFLNELIHAGFQMGQIEQTLEYAFSALEIAQTLQDENKVVDLLIQIGEANLISGRFDQALGVYHNALQGAKSQARTQDTAYLTGRIAYTLAEMGRLDQAILHHQQAIDLASQENLPELHGEQLSYLAMAFLENKQTAQAADTCLAAIDVFTAGGLENQAEKARRLLAQIQA